MKNTSSPPEMFLGKGVVKICSRFTGEHPCRSEISIKLLCSYNHCMKSDVIDKNTGQLTSRDILRGLILLLDKYILTACYLNKEIIKKLTISYIIIDSNSRYTFFTQL